MPQRMAEQVRERRRYAKVVDYSRGDRGRLIKQLIKSIVGEFMGIRQEDGKRSDSFGTLCFYEIVSLLCSRGFISPIAVRGVDTVLEDILLSERDADTIARGIRQVFQVIYPARIGTREARLFMHLHTQALYYIKGDDWIVRIFTDPDTTEIETKNFLRVL